MITPWNHHPSHHPFVTYNILILYIPSSEVHYTALTKKKIVQSNKETNHKYELNKWYEALNTVFQKEISNLNNPVTIKISALILVNTIFRLYFELTSFKSTQFVESIYNFKKGSIANSTKTTLKLSRRKQLCNGISYQNDTDINWGRNRQPVTRLLETDIEIFTSAILY